MWSNRYSCQTLLKLEFSRKFSKNTRIKFHENPSSGSLVVLCGRVDRQTDMTKLIIAFRSFANRPKITAWHGCCPLGQETPRRYYLQFYPTSIPVTSWQVVTSQKTLMFISVAVERSKSIAHSKANHRARPWYSAEIFICYCLRQLLSSDLQDRGRLWHFNSFSLQTNCLVNRHLFYLRPIKVKFTLEQAMNAQRWSRGIALLFH
jgi:hypothetical protein